jgi:site-specific recombinase XerD
MANTSLIDNFLDYKRVERQASPNTLEAYRYDLREFCDSLTGKSPTDAQESDIRAYLLHCNIRNLNPASINRRVSALREFYKQLQRDGVISHDPMRRVSLMKTWKRLPKAISEDEAVKLLDCAPTRKSQTLRDRAIIELLWATGIRVSELTGAKIQDVNFENRCMRVWGKGQKERIVPLGLPAVRALQAYLSQPRQESPFLFPGRNGKQMTRTNVFLLIEHRAERAGIAHLSPHGLRHTCATHLIDHGADLRVVQEILGHSEVSTTQIYLKVTPSHLKDILFRCHPRSNPVHAQMKLFQPKSIPITNARPCSECAAPAAEGKRRCEHHLRQGRAAHKRHYAKHRVTETPRKKASIAVPPLSPSERACLLGGRIHT